MIFSYKNYKPTGLQWLGKIPEHWLIGRLKNFVNLNPAKGNSGYHPSMNLSVSFLPMEKVFEDGTFDNSIILPIEEVWNGFTYFKKNDVLMAKITPCFENGKGAYLRELKTEIGFGTTEFHVLRASDTRIINSYIFYLIRSEMFMQMGEAMMIGAAGQKRVPSSFVRSFVFGLPTPVEQVAIVKYLDEKTSKIDLLISNKKGQIEKLKEIRQIEINTAVTKGLNPNAKLKPSGIEWLGDVPEHWEVKRLKKVVSKFVDYRGKTPDKTTEGVVLVTARNIKNGKISFENSIEYMAEIDYNSWMVRGLPKIGDLLFTTEAPLGEVALIEEEYIALAQRIIMFKVKTNEVNSKFLMYFFQSNSGKDEVQRLATGSTALGIKGLKLPNVRSIIPPLLEQAYIINYLDEKTSKIDQLVSNIEKQIEQLEEIRKIEIYNAVTGKIKVA